MERLHFHWNCWRSTIKIGKIGEIREKTVVKPRHICRSGEKQSQNPGKNVSQQKFGVRIRTSMVITGYMPILGLIYNFYKYRIKRRGSGLK